MEMTYKIVYQEHVIKKHIPALSIAIKQLIKTAIETKLIVDPLIFGKPLRYSLKNHRRLRVSDYRVIFNGIIKFKVEFIINHFIIGVINYIKSIRCLSTFQKQCKNFLIFIVYGKLLRNIGPILSLSLMLGVDI